MFMLFTKMRRRMRAAVLMLTALVIVFSPLSADALPACHYEHDSFTGEDCYEPGSIEASYIDYIQGRWKCDTQLAKRGGLCGYWSNLVLDTVAAKRKQTDYYGLRFNKKNFLKVCKGVKPGTKLVLGQAKYENGTLSHAIVLLKVTSDEVWWADCNWNDDNVIHYRHGSVTDFINFYHYKSYKYSYLHFIRKVTRYRIYDTPMLVSCEAIEDGTARIAWTKTRNTYEYRVYRSASKKGKFKRIATTKDCSYTDHKASIGKTYYYKVAAVKRNGDLKKSNIVSTKTRLDRPRVSIRFKKGHKKGRLYWDPVEGADRYVVWRRCGTRGKWYKVKETKKTSYTDKYMKRTYRGNEFWYRVRAVTDGKAWRGSLYSPWVSTSRRAWQP